MMPRRPLHRVDFDDASDLSELRAEVARGTLCCTLFRGGAVQDVRAVKFSGGRVMVKANGSGYAPPVTLFTWRVGK